MLRSGVSLAPLSYKKVEHRDEILHYKSTTQSQERMIPMLNQDYTAKVLNLEDVIITNVENISDVLHICLELPRQKHRCPACGALTDRIHDYRMQTIKDIPMGRETLLHLRKRATGAAAVSASLKKLFSPSLLPYYQPTCRCNYYRVP